MALFIPAALFDDAALRCPRRRRSAWDPEDVLTPYDELLDSIVSPLLGAPARLLLSSPCGHACTQGRQPARQPAQLQRPRWAQCVELPGFSSEEVTTEVKDGRVVILGRHVQGEGDNQDVYEVKRTVALPPDVDAEKVVCRHVPGRFVVVEGPRVQNESQAAAQEVPIQQQADAPATAERSDAAPHQEPVSEAPAPAATTEPAPTQEDGAASSAGDVPEAPRTSPAAAECPDSSSEETSVMRVAGDAAETRPADTAAPPEDNVTSAPQAENERDAENVDAPAKQTASVKPMTQPAPAEVSSSPLKMQEGGKSLSVPSQFEVGLDLRGFAPENVKVSVNGNSLVVEATRVEEGEYYSGTEQFRREVTLPRNVDGGSVRCFMGEDGRLKVTAPYAAASDTVTVPIIAA